MESEHLQSAQSLTPRLLGREGLELHIDTVMKAELDLRLEAVLEGGQAEIVEARDLALKEPFEGQLHIRRSAPEPECVPKRGGTLAGRKGTRVSNESLESMRINRAGVDGEYVARRDRVNG